MYILQPCVNMSTLCCPRSDTVVLLIWVCFCFFFNVFFFPSFCSVRWGIFLVPFPPCLLFMKLENLKDCCVFVNNKTCALCACKCPSSKLLLLEPVSPRMWSVFDVPPPPPPHSDPHSLQCERVGPDPFSGTPKSL